MKYRIVKKTNLLGDVGFVPEAYVTFKDGWVWKTLKVYIGGASGESYKPAWCLKEKEAKKLIDKDIEKIKSETYSEDVVYEVEV